MKRRLLALTIILVLFMNAFVPSIRVQATTTENGSTASWPSGPNVFAESAIVMEASTGLILYEKNINEVHYPASITKILTTLLAIENSSMGEIVTFSKEAVFGVDLNSSRVGIDVGEQLTMQQCLYAILLESANEVACAVAEHVAGSVEAFAQMMNDRAKELGCQNTHFVNPHGLPDPEHYTSAYDMALITREAMKNETFRKIFNTRTYIIPPTNLQSEQRPLRNHHRFVLKQDYFYNDCIGGKTGYTSKAKYTLVSVAKRGDLELICVVMRDDSNEHQYTDTQKLFDYGFDNFSIYTIADLENSEILTESPFFTKYNALLSDSDSPIMTDEDGYLILPKTASFEEAKKEVTFYSPTDASSIQTDENGNKIIGKISYTYNNKYVGGADILYSQDTKLALIHNQTEKNKPTSTPETPVPDSEEKESLRPIIIGGIVGLLVIAIIIYYVLVELPRIRRRKAYYKKRARRRRYMDNDFLDL